MQLVQIVYGTLVELRSLGIKRHAQWEQLCEVAAQLTHSDTPRKIPNAPFSCTGPVWPKQHAEESPQNPSPRDRASAEPLSADPTQPHRSQPRDDTTSSTIIADATGTATASPIAAAAPFEEEITCLPRFNGDWPLSIGCATPRGMAGDALRGRFAGVGDEDNNVESSSRASESLSESSIGEGSA